MTFFRGQRTMSLSYFSRDNLDHHYVYAKLELFFSVYITLPASSFNFMCHCIAQSFSIMQAFCSLSELSLHAG